MLKRKRKKRKRENIGFIQHKSDTYNFIGRLDNLALANSLDFSISNTNAHIKEHEEDGSFKVMNNNSTAYNFKFNLDSDDTEKKIII